MHTGMESLISVIAKRDSGSNEETLKGSIKDKKRNSYIIPLLFT